MGSSNSKFHWIKPSYFYHRAYFIELTLTDRMLILPYEIKNKPWLKIQGTTVIVTYFKINFYVSSLQKIKRKVSPALKRRLFLNRSLAKRK